MEDFEISENGVLTELQGLNVHKSVGPDGLSPHLLSMLATQISPTLTQIFNQSLHLGKSPLDWKLQHITPILKPGKNKTDPSSYRPIALTSICCKVLEHVIYSQSMKHLEKHNILSELQHGYRRGCSTETQLLKVIDLFAKGLDNKSQVDSISLDFSRAFDVVPHQRLLLKMDFYGIRKILPWIEDFLTNRNQVVVIDGTKSRLVKVLSGCPQGTVIAALCFLIFINDLPDSVKGSFSGIFCDDTLLAKEIVSKADTEVLQKDLDQVFVWSQMWGMKFNTLKCVTMTVTNKRAPLMHNYVLDGKTLLRQDYIKYLGITIDSKLSFKLHIEDKCKRATTVLNMIRRNLHFAPKSVKAKAYTSCVRPIIEYGSTCWSPTSAKYNHSVEMVQHNAAKFITNKYPRKGHYNEFSVTALLNDLKLEPLEERRNRAKLTMAYKIINGHVILPPDLLPGPTINRPVRSCNQARVGPVHQLAEPHSKNKIQNPAETFFFAVPKLWNARISPEQAAAPSVDSFKNFFAF